MVARTILYSLAAIGGDKSTNCREPCSANLISAGNRMGETDLKIEPVSNAANVAVSEVKAVALSLGNTTPCKCHCRAGGQDEKRPVPRRRFRSGWCNLRPSGRADNGPPGQRRCRPRITSTSRW